MKHICYISLAVLLLLFTAACEKGASFEVSNQCSYPAWVSVDGDSLITLAPGESRNFDISTDTESVLSGTVYESFKVIAYGETFSLEREVDGHFIPTDSTTVKIQAGENRRAPLIPNRASLKVTNDSSTPIEKAEIWKHTALTHIKVGTIFDLAPGTHKFYRGEYAVTNNMFFYTVLLYLPGIEEPLSYGNEGTILGKDEQFHVIYTDPVSN